ncbi:MAG TPA: phage/plasmid primase, P4 family, partial [Nitrospiraceae bacterium]|nr:phage/plasmid primase, P4 family [Nitrospiraceae bacterium]
VFEAIGSSPPRWHSRDDGALVRCVRTLSAELYGNAISSGNPTALEAAVKYADAREIRDATVFCQSDRRVIISPHDVDSDPWVIGAPNGYIDLRTGTLHPHDTSHIITKSVRPVFDPKADCPAWMAWLEQMLPSASVRLFIQRLAGYSLTGLMSEQIFPFLHGIGANGKSTLIEVLFHLMGSYALKAPDRLVHMDDRGSTPPDVIAAIDGVRFLAGPETTEGARLNEGTIKDLVGGDSMSGARKYEHQYTFSPVAKLWCFGNHKPVIRGTDDGIWRRIRLVHFPVQIASHLRDGHLKERLKSEDSGILTWAVEGCLEWQRDGLKTPDSISSDTQQYREDEDPLADFLSERTCDAQGQSISVSNLYASYQSWASASGIRNQLTNRALGNKLRDRGWIQVRTTAYRSWSGKMLINAPTPLDL